MKKFRKNNKGFSLVELIVVVLIIAIIAVALAPQVIKWVGTAGDNTDTNNEATIKAAVQTCVAEYMASGNPAPSIKYEATAGKASTTLKAASGETDIPTLTDLIQKAVDEVPALKGSTGGTKHTKFTITITAGTVSVKAE